jgi:hypothetical protein
MFVTCSDNAKHLNSIVIQPKLKSPETPSPTVATAARSDTPSPTAAITAKTIFFNNFQPLTDLDLLPHNIYQTERAQLSLSLSPVLAHHSSIFMKLHFFKQHL